MIQSIVTFGEMLLRLSPPGHLRLQQAQALDVAYGGAEANVAVSLANFGLPVQYVTRLPDSDLGRTCRLALRRHGVALDHVVTGGERLGLYFLEVGAGGRPSQVIYDRAHSSFASLAPGMVDWDEVFAGAGWFHWSGISPALSAGAARVTGEAVAAARRAGLVVSCDLNYRHTLWQWGAAPRDVMPALVAQCDVLLANSAHMLLDVPPLPAGSGTDEALDACAHIARAFPNLRHIALTVRHIAADGAQQYAAVLRTPEEQAASRSFTLSAIVDRVGAGDAFMAGLIYGLHQFPTDAARIVDFATAAAVLKHTIVGDANLVSVAEIEQLPASNAGLDIRR